KGVFYNSLNSPKSVNKCNVYIYARYLKLYLIRNQPLINLLIFLDSSKKKKNPEYPGFSYNFL
ncbi:MAG: hypothetical protein CML87_04340, partial [Rhodobiaceae bacterium]|nr:hypothetical protein [Rhodobiaceae bacterium]